jgi:hypothetical protein
MMEYKYKIEQDMYSESPAENMNTDLFLITEARCPLDIAREGFNAEAILAAPRTAAKQYPNYWFFPCRVYAGSQPSIVLTGNKDHQNAVIAVEKACWPTQEAAWKAADLLCDEWDTYLQGEVYGYIIEDESGNHVDSCWGFYGYEYCEQTAKELIAFYQEEEKDNLCPLSLVTG